MNQLSDTTSIHDHNGQTDAIANTLIIEWPLLMTAQAVSNVIIIHSINVLKFEKKFTYEEVSFHYVSDQITMFTIMFILGFFECHRLT